MPRWFTLDAQPLAQLEITGLQGMGLSYRHGMRGDCNVPCQNHAKSQALQCRPNSWISAVPKRASCIEWDRIALSADAMLEVFFNGNPVNVVLLQKALSRETVKLNPLDPFEGVPIVDPMTFVNPVDLEIDLAMMRFARKWYATPSMAPLISFETVPGSNVTSDEDLIAAVGMFSIPSIGHRMGTNAMMPLEFGGVVGPDSLVYGLKELSIVDASVTPLAHATHICSTVYAIAEKAADLIKSRAKY